MAHPYRLSAIEWMVRVAGPQRFTPALRDFAIAMDQQGAYAELTASDAHDLTTAILGDFVVHDDPAGALRARQRALLCGEDGITWDDPHAVYRTLLIAAKIAGTGP